MITPTFHRLSDEKKQRILDQAARHFATQGFHKANVNEIAASSDISVGALYTYFDTKEDVFEAVMSEALGMMDTVHARALNPGRSLHQQLSDLFEDAVMIARRRPAYVEVFLSLSAPGMEPFATVFGPSMERGGAELWHDLLSRGRDSGELRPDLDVPAAAFLLDNNLMALYASVSNAFFSIHRQELLKESPSRITRQWARHVAGRLLSLLWEGIRNPQAPHQE